MARFALEVHSGLKDCEDTLAAIRGVSGGRLHLAVVSTAKYFAPRLLAEFSRRHPGVTVKLSVTNREQVIGELQANQVDLAIMGRPPRGLDVDATAFAKHPHGIIASPEHPLARRRGLELARLAGENFLIREPGSGTRMSMERVFADHGVKLASSMELASNETIKQAVMAGMGLTFLSLHTVGPGARRGQARAPGRARHAGHPRLARGQPPGQAPVAAGGELPGLPRGRRRPADRGDDGRARPRENGGNCRKTLKEVLAPGGEIPYNSVPRLT